MSINTSSHSSPNSKKFLKTVLAQKGESPMSRFKKEVTEQLSKASSKGVGPKITCKGFTELDEALAVKNMLEERGIGQNVRFDNSDYECEIRSRGFKPVIFSFVVPAGLTAQEIRETVAAACVADQEEFDRLEEVIRLDDRYLLIREQMLSSIISVREKLNQTETKKSQIEEFGELLQSFTNIISIMNAQDQTQATETTTSTTNQEITMENTTQATQATQASEVTQANETPATMSTELTTTQVAVVPTVATAEKEQPAKVGFFSTHKKKLMIGGAVLGAGALAYLGFRNFDKIEAIFSKTGEAAQ